MTFVSIVGNDKYINVVADGLATFDNGLRIENYEKIIHFGDRFISFAGTVQSCNIVIEQAKKLKNLPYEVWERELIRTTIEISYDVTSSKALICIGGRENSKLTFSSFSNKPGQEVQKFTPKNSDDISFSFLSNYENDEALESEFIKCIKRYRSFKSRDVLLAQIDLNEFVSNSNPNQVNKQLMKITFK